MIFNQFSLSQNTNQYFQNLWNEKEKQKEKNISKADQATFMIEI